MRNIKCILLIVICLSSCERDFKLKDLSDPILNTQLIEDIESDGTTFKAEVLEGELIHATEFGFILDVYNKSITLPVGFNKDVSQFELKYKGGIDKNAVYRVQSYIKNDDKHIIGTSSFMGLRGRKLPFISSFEPKEAKYTDKVYISGGNLSSYYFIRVYIGNRRAYYVKHDKMLEVTIPPFAAKSTDVTVKVFVDLFEFELEEKLHILK